MTDVLSGESVSDLFQGFLKKHSPDSFISIKFGQNGGTTLNMVAESKEVADFWVRGLRKLILNKGLFISNKRFLSMLTTYYHTAEREKNAPAACRLFSRGVIFTRAHVSLALLSLRKNGGLLVAWLLYIVSLFDGTTFSHRQYPPNEGPIFCSSVFVHAA